MRGGKLLSWPEPALEWTGHGGGVNCVSYSPNGCYIITGSDDMTIRIWDAETGLVVSKPLEGHTGHVRSVAYSPNGRNIISGSDDTTIRIWNADTGSSIGKPLEGHTRYVVSVAYSPDGRHVISGSDDKTIRVWNAGTGSAVGKPLEGHTRSVTSVAYSPDGQHIISESSYGAIHLWNSFSHIPILLIPPKTTGCPGPDGWVKDIEGGLLYWVPQDCRAGLHSPVLLTIPITSPIRSVSLHLEGFAFGHSWTQIFKAADSVVTPTDSVNRWVAGQRIGDDPFSDRWW